MRIIDKVSQALQRLLGPLAEEAAQSSNVIVRKRKFSAMSLARTFILGFLAKPDASDEDLAQIAVQGGVEVTPQAIEQRYTPRMEQFLHELFCQATTMVVGSDKALAPILERFTEVTILDSSIITLPEDKKDCYRGCGGKHEGGEAAMKLQVELDLRSGALTHVQLEPGRSPDGATSRQQARRGKGSLRIADLGYFNLAVFEEMSKEGAYYLSRLQNPIVLRDLAGTVVDLAQWLGLPPASIYCLKFVS
jgi:Transposase DDE domain